MKRKYYWLFVLLSLTNFLYASPNSEKSLAEIYKGGTVRFIPEVTIDESSMPEDIFFARVADITCDNDGFVYVCDSRANNIKKFSQEGEYIATIGRKGQGPGEFNWPFLITINRSHIFVWDMGNYRICKLTTEGDFILNMR